MRTLARTCLALCIGWHYLCGACLAEGRKTVAVAVYDVQLAASKGKSDDEALKELEAGKEEIDDEVIKILKAMEDVVVDRVDDLSLSALLEFDVLVIPPPFASKEADAQLQVDVPAFVAVGGGVVATFIHGGQTIRLPDIATCQSQTWFWRGADKLKTVVPTKDHPVTQGLPDEFDLTHVGYFTFHPGPRGKVIARDKKGSVYGVAGEHGSGRYVALGGAPGKAGAGWDIKNPAELKGAEAQLLQNAVRWASGASFDQKKVRALFQEEVAALKKTWTERSALMDTANEQLSDLLKEAKPETAAEGKRELENASAAREAVEDEIATLEKKLADQPEGDLRPVYGALHKELMAIRGPLADKAVTSALALREAHRKLSLDMGRKFVRNQPRYPRGTYHPGARVTGGYSWGDFEMMATDYHMNFVASAFQRYEATAKWATEKEVARWLGYADLFGLGAMSLYHYGIDDRGWKGAEQVFPVYLQYPAFFGFSIDEPRYSPFHGAWRENHPNVPERFREWLEQNHSAGELAEMGVTDVAAAEIPQPAEAKRKPLLWSKVAEFSRDRLRSLMQRDLEYVRSLDPQLLVTLDLQGIGAPVWYADLAPLGKGTIMCEPYDRAQFRQNYTCELLRGCTGGKVWKWIAPGLHYAYHDRTSMYRTLYQAMSHADGIGVFHWNWVKPQMSGYSGDRKAWNPCFSEVIPEVFGQIERLEDYLADTESTAQVAILISERTLWNTRYGDKGFELNLQSLYQTLSMRCHVPTDFLFAEMLGTGTGGDRIDRYKVLLAPSAECLSSREVALIRKWIEAGGVLIATGGTSRFDEHGRPSPDYALSAELGVSYVKTIPDATSLAAEIVASEGVLASLPAGASMAYAAGKQKASYDLVKAAPEAKVLARWSDEAKSPAIVLRTRERGAGVYLGHTYLGAAPQEEVSKLLNDFVGWGLSLSKARPNVTVTNCPETVDVNLRSQPVKKRLMLHLVSFGGGPHAGVQAQVAIPETWGDAVSVREAMTGAKTECEIRNGAAALNVPDFSQYSLVILEGK